jgi:hypothetical protein
MLQPINIVIGTGWIIAGLVALGLSIPLMANRIGPNPLYGIRFRESFQSDQAWYAINQFGGKRMALWSLPQIACGIAAYFLPLDNNPTLTLVAGLAPLAFVLVPVLETWRFAKRSATTERP